MTTSGQVRRRFGMARLSAEKWAEVKARWSVGKMTNRDIGEIFGVSHTAIQQRADKESWVKLDENLVDSAIDASMKLSILSKTNNLESFHVKTEIDRHASDKAEADEVGMDIMQAIKLQIRGAEAVDIQRLAAAHKSVYDGRFKVTPDTAIQINNVQDKLPQKKLSREEIISELESRGLPVSLINIHED